MKTDREKQLEKALALFIKAHDMSPRAEVTVGIDRDIAICTQYLAEAYSAATALIDSPRKRTQAEWKQRGERQGVLIAIAEERTLTDEEREEWSTLFSHPPNYEIIASRRSCGR